MGDNMENGSPGAIQAAYDPRRGSGQLSAKRDRARRDHGRAIAAAFEAAARRADGGGTIELKVFDGPGAKRSAAAKASGLPDFRSIGKHGRKDWAHAFSEAEGAGLLRISWCADAEWRLPLSAALFRGDLAALAAFFADPTSASPAVQRPRAKKAARQTTPRLARPALADAAALLDAAEAACGGPLAMALAAAADEIAQAGRSSSPAVERAREGGRLASLCAVASTYPAPLPRPLELRVASAAALGNSKALDGAAGTDFARLIQESGAVEARSEAEALARWGLMSEGPRIWVGGGVLLQFPGSPGIDLAVLGESWCAPCSALREASSVDPRDCRAVIVVENFAAWRQSVRDLGSLALFLYVDGVMSGEREDCLGALLALCPAGFPAFAWNDLDAAGFSRFDALARDYPSLRPLLMDCETLAAMPDSRLRPMGDNRKAVLREYLDANPSSRFAPAGRALLSRGRFLEQEALLDGYAQRELGFLLGGLPRAHGGAAMG